MQRHVSNYLTARDLTPYEPILCEICGAISVDIHHIVPRSKFGSKTKELQDDFSNLIALCRKCHEKAHNEQISKAELYTAKRV